MYIYQIVAISNKKRMVGNSFTDYNTAITRCEELATITHNNGLPIEYYIQPIEVTTN